MDENFKIKAQIDHFQKELDVVNETLVSISEDDSNRQDLCELKIKLEEILELNKNKLLEFNKEQLYQALDQFESELNYQKKKKFKDELINKSIHTSKDDSANELKLSLNNLEGKICRAPYQYESGKVEYHNAMIMSVEEICENEKDIKVKVLFINPINISMKTCVYYLQGKCHYSDSRCKYSHGFEVFISQLAEFVETDLANLVKDSKCLVKDESKNLWRKAIIDKHIDGVQLMVNLIEESKTVLVNIENVIPFHEDDNNENLKDEDYNSLIFNDNDSDEEKPVIAWDKIDFQSSALGEWEKYTKGIGSKLMKKMGYIWGSGLGKSSEGRIEPIETIVLPAGKSLDYCLKFKEQLLSKKKTQFKLEKVKLEQIAKRYQSSYENFFNFLNHTLKKDFKKLKNKNEEASSSTEFKKSLKLSTNCKLNVDSFKISEEIKKAQIDLLKIERGIERNENKDKIVYQNLYSKLSFQKKFLESLRQKEKSIEQEKKIRETHKKLTQF